MSKERAEDSQTGRIPRSAWYEGLCAIGQIGRQPGWRDHQAWTMNGGSEHLNGCSQWVQVESQIMITNMRCGNRIVTLLCKRRSRRVCLGRQWRRMTRKDNESPCSSLFRRSSRFGYEGRKLRGMRRRRINQQGLTVRSALDTSETTQ